MHPQPAQRPHASSDPRPVIGIVGGIGSGKSEVARVLRGLGCEVCESDIAARQVLGEPAVRALVDAAVRGATGGSVLAPDGSVDRGMLAKAIFASAGLRKSVESIMHPRIEALRRAQFAAAPASAPAFVIDAPLLLEVGLDRECDAVIYVDAPREQRLARVAASRAWDGAELGRRESAQLPLEEKRARSTHVVVNDAGPEALRGRVEEVLRTILADASARGPG